MLVFELAYCRPTHYLKVIRKYLTYLFGILKNMFDFGAISTNFFLLILFFLFFYFTKSYQIKIKK